jgi:hypothetical protein
MSIEPKTLPLDPLPVGEDYALLREEMVRRTQELSGRIWTNYNFSDPGVTMVEQLCFALTELSYRAAYPVADLLTAPTGGKLDGWHQALYPAPAILPVNPVTIDDLRRLLLDRVRGLANVWITPLDRDAGAGGERVGGLYAVRLWAGVGEGNDGCFCPNPDERHRLRSRVLDVYAAHRALGEDIGELVELAPLPSLVSARVTLTDAADPAAVMAGLLFALEQALAPTPARHSLAAALAMGRTPSQILEGPRLLRGLIADAELGPQPVEIRVMDLLHVMERVPGVALVQDLAVRIPADADPVGVDGSITLPPDTLAALITGMVAGHWPLRLWQRGGRRTPDERQVERKLRGLRRVHGRTFDMVAEYAQYWAPPIGVPRDLSAYGSLQCQFPAAYGIGQPGPLADMPASRQGQILQLAGYLMPFDQMMADYFAQLAFLRDLYSPKAGGDHTYAWQSLRGQVPHAARILRPGYERGMALLTDASDPVLQRQADILAYLLSLYGEVLQQDSDDGDGKGTQPTPALVRARRQLLRRLVSATGARGRGLDWRRPWRHGGRTGMETRTAIQLDLLNATPAGQDGDDGGDDHHGHGWQPPPAVERLAADLLADLDRRFMPIERVLDDLALADAQAPPPAHLSPALLAALGDPARYRVGLHPQTSQVLLICCCDDGVWWLLGEFGGSGAALEAARRWLACCRPRGRDLYIVEYVLLRYARTITQDPAESYSFRLAAVVGVSARQWRDRDWRAQAESIIRENTPTHLALQCHFLRDRPMQRFRQLYRDWRDALASGDARWRARSSARLQGFLAHHAPGCDDAGDWRDPAEEGQD